MPSVEAKGGAGMMTGVKGKKDVGKRCGVARVILSPRV